MAVVISRSLVARCAIILTLLAIGYSAVTRSFAIALAKNEPVLALDLSSGDARIMGRAAQVSMEAAKTEGDRRRANELARKALARDATVVPAVTTTGFFAGLASDDQKSAKWFAYSEQLSRRDVRTQLYFIENSVSSGNIAEALQHYDIALRTSDASAPTILYPVLREAITDQPVRRELAKTLARKPLWASAFIGDLVVKGPDFAAVADLLLDARRRGAVILPSSDEILLNNLIAKADILTAWKYYLAVHPGADRLLIRNATFSADKSGSLPFDWQVVAGDGVVASLGAGNNGQVLEYRLSPTVGGPVISQMTMLSEGRYRLSTTLASVSQDLGTGPYWNMKCTDGRPIATLELGGPLASPKTFSSDLIVPQNCPSQLLTLVVRSSDDVQGATGQVASVLLRPLQ